MSKRNTKSSSEETVSPRSASTHTKRQNQKVQQDLPFEDRTDFEDALRGFIDRLDPLTVKNDYGQVVWDMEKYKDFIHTLDHTSPDSVNPSLWRNARLNLINGLFEVVEEKIFQVRTFDLSNMTFIRGNTGWIIFDVLLCEETAQEAYELVKKNIADLPIKAIIYSHSHADHFGGVKGLVSQDQVDSGEVAIIAPEDFTEHAVSENFIAGNAMSRRAVYMYGSLLSPSELGGVNEAWDQLLHLV